ncbi:MAG: fibronectin type III domain-containing protein, partial [Bacteroidales bacterium]|nr:fibronectin type III domain-containing protein [Bacteroidales bacterium]
MEQTSTGGGRESDRCGCITGDNARRYGRSWAVKSGGGVVSLLAVVARILGGGLLAAAALLLTAQPSAAQGLTDYTFSTGTDASRWITLTNTTQLCTEEVGDYGHTKVLDIGFPFHFGDAVYTQWSACGDGVLSLGSTVVNTHNSCIYNAGDQLDDGCAVIIVPYGHDGACGDEEYGPEEYIYAQTFGDTMLVVEFSVSKTYNSGDGTSIFQVQLYKSGRVQFVYGTGQDVKFQVGMCVDDEDGWVVKSTHTAEHFTEGSNETFTTWPGANRYYNWLPGGCTYFYREDFNGYTDASCAGGSGCISADGTTPPTTYPNHILPTCWTFTGMGATSSDYPQVYITNSSTYCTDGLGLVVKTINTAGDLYAVLPKRLDAPTAQLMLKFSYCYSHATRAGKISYGIMTDPNDASTFREVESLAGVGNTYWQTVSCIFGNRTAFTTAMTSAGLNPSTDKVYIAFKIGATTTGTYYTSIDNVRLEAYSQPTGSLPYAEDFDSYGTNADYYSSARATLPVAYPNHYLPSGWLFPTMLESSGKAYADVYLTAASGLYVSGKALLFKTRSYSPRLYAAVDRNFGDARKLKFKLKYRVYNASYGKITCGYMTDPSDTTTFHALASTISTSFTEVSGNLSSAPANALLAFRFDNYSSTGYGALDNLTICKDTIVDTTAVSAYCSFKWYNSEKTSSGTYTKTHTGVGGCDSTVRLSLTINDPSLPYTENFDAYTADISNSSDPPAAYPSHQLPGCWTFTGLDARSGTSYDFNFTTGTDASRWKTLTSTTDLCDAGDGEASELQNIGFTFPYLGTNYTKFSVNTDFSLKLGNEEGDEIGTDAYSNPFTSSNAGKNAPKFNGIGLDGQKEDDIHHIYAQTFGDTMLVVEFAMRAYDDEDGNVLSYQVQLFASGRVQFVYPSAAPTAPPAASYQIGMCVNASNGWIVNSDLTCSHFIGGSTSKWDEETWQDAGRYYLWHPTSKTADYPQAFLTTSNAYSGKSLTMSEGASSDVAYAVLPEFDESDIAHLRLDFYYRQLATDATEGTLTIGTMTNASDPSTFTALRTLSKTTSWTRIQDTLCFHSPSASARYLAFRYAGGTGSTQMAMLDNVNVTYIACLPVSGITVSNITTSGFRLSWTDYNSASTAYNITATGNGTTYNFTTSTGATYYDCTGLEGGTAYMVTVTPACGGDARTSYATTSCISTISIPYVETFDYYRGNIASVNTAPTGYPSTHTMPCWTFTGMSASTSTYPQAFITGNSSYRVEGNGLVFKTKSGQSVLYAALPNTDGVPTATLRLRFAYKYNNTSYAGQLSYGFMTDPSDASTYHNIADLSKSNTSWNSTACTFADNATFASALTAEGLDASTANVYIAFKIAAGGSSSLGYTAIDNIRIDAPSCSATLPYTENFDSYSGNGVSTGTSVPSTAGYAYPYCHDMASCWTFPYMSTTTSTYPQVFITSHSDYQVSGNGLIFKTNNSAPRAWAILAKDFGIDPIRLAFSFKYKVSNSSYCYLDYGVTTDLADTSKFVSLGKTNSTSWGTVTDTIARHLASLPAGRPLYPAFRFYDKRASTAVYYGALDNLQVTDACSSSPAPTDLVINSTSTTGFTVSWTDNTSGSKAHVLFKDGVKVADIARGTTSYTFTDLTAGTRYLIGVASKCGTNLHSDTLERFAWTLAATGTIPYVETFDTYSTTSGNYSTGLGVPSNYPNHDLPTDWSLPYMSITSATQPWAFLTCSTLYKIPNTSGATHKSLQLRANLTGGTPSSFACVAKGLGLASSRLAFTFYYMSTNKSNARIYYGYMTDPNDTTTFVALGNTNTSSGLVHVKDAFNLHAGVPSTAYLAFRARVFSGAARSGIVDSLRIFDCRDTVDTTAVSVCGGLKWWNTDRTTTGTYYHTFSGANQF